MDQIASIKVPIEQASSADGEAGLIVRGASGSPIIASTWDSNALKRLVSADAIRGVSEMLGEPLPNYSGD